MLSCDSPFPPPPSLLHKTLLLSLQTAASAGDSHAMQRPFASTITLMDFVAARNSYLNENPSGDRGLCIGAIKEVDSGAVLFVSVRRPSSADGGGVLCDAPVFRAF